jgi:hypothetical protein
VRGTNLKWIQAQGGWASAKLLLDTYGHFLPTETTGYADALSGDPRRPYTALAFSSGRRLGTSCGQAAMAEDLAWRPGEESNPRPAA